MVIEPYRRRPKAPTVAVMTEQAVAVDEHGDTLDFDDWPPGTRCWCSYDVARDLVNRGVGEAVCWQNEEIHWRHRRLDEDGWKSRASDVHVVKLPFPNTTAETLRGLARWRDWLDTNGAACLSTSGSAAWSLLRATLDTELRTSEPFREAPPLRFTLGGRQELGPRGSGTFTGRLELWDMPAAYASTLGKVRYGGMWRQQSQVLPDGDGRPVEWWGAQARAVFVRAKVAIPELTHGPLPRRPRSARDAYLKLGLGAEYPTGETVQGIWTLEEIRAAEEAGCRVVKVLDVWTHFSTGREPFAAWWAAIVEGRRARGFAGQLAKMTGNALWGRLCMDGRYGRRTIRSRTGKTLGGSRLVSRPLVMRGGQPPAHDLAETVSGRVRAQLYSAMTVAGPALLSAHTDGVWIEHGAASEILKARGWRLKTRARRLDLLTPQHLRYWNGQPWSPTVVYSGVPASLAEQAFEEAWARGGLEVAA